MNIKKAIYSLLGPILSGCVAALISLFAIHSGMFFQPKVGFIRNMFPSSDEGKVASKSVMKLFSLILLTPSVYGYICHKAQKSHVKLLNRTLLN
ncbi:MAG: hypothetical protein A2169_07375 [Deltaproteobacteria bacterium RBG_13_47_9]|nr:MAG: hypothetical protein A2169_07375 [Deltaproteobacteria bacterium RBG_13_47_9]